MKSKIVGLWVLGFVFVQAPAWANSENNSRGHQQGSEQGPERGSQPRKPPKEALEACQGKSSGTECSFSGRNGEQVQGTCFAPNENLPLACKPSHAPQEGHGKV